MKKALKIVMACFLIMSMIPVSIFAADVTYKAIDAKVRQELRSWLRELISTVGITSIFVTHDLDEAIEKEQLLIYLQPQVSAKGKVIGSEALIRWIHPEKGAIMPNEFIPIFEKNGLIIDIDRYIWEMACRILRKWKEEGREKTI